MFMSILLLELNLQTIWHLQEIYESLQKSVIDKLVLLMKFSQCVDVGSYDHISKCILPADIKPLLKTFL